MARHRVPITPRNYAVWYAYAAGENSALLGAIDAMIAKDEPFTEACNERLYLEFGFGRDAHEIKKLRDELLRVLFAIMSEVAEIKGKTVHYESFLSDSVGLLDDNVSIQDIKTVVDCIIQETKAVVAFGKETQQRVEHITDELKTLQDKFEQARSEALRDFLTGIANRQAFDNTLARLTDEAEAAEEGLCLLVIDIDHFKKFNDLHGHVVGDEVLRFTARQLKNQVRGNDFVARIGGEEFAVLLPRTSLAGATAVAENIRTFFSSANLKTAGNDKKLGRITLSIGLACYVPGETDEHFMTRADKALYAAKAAGRDRLVAASVTAAAAPDS